MKQARSSAGNDTKRRKPSNAREVGGHLGKVTSRQLGAGVQKDPIRVGVAVNGQVSDDVFVQRCKADADAMLLTVLFVDSAHQPERLVLSVDRNVGAVRLPKQAVRQRNAQVVNLAAHLQSLPFARLAVLSGRQGCGKTSIAEALRWQLGLDRIVDEWYGRAPIQDGSLAICNESAWRLEGIGQGANGGGE